jgi:ureidoglycolate lyase
MGQGTHRVSVIRVIEKLTLSATALTAETFAPFGQVIERSDHGSYAINDGSSQRFSDLAQLEADPNGRLALSIFQAQAQTAPFLLRKLERHPLGSQAFVPLHGQPFLIVVAMARPDPDSPNMAALRGFLSNGQQGINFKRGTWHHPLIALQDGDFLVADRLGPGHNCEEVDIAHWNFHLTLSS